jgi:sulfatase maturation enzyme AslB (radical SAM superfamily)
VNKLSIQWQIGNQCNFRCDYCHSDFHSGSNPFLEYEQFQRGFRHLQESVKDYTNIEIEFQGGEPTISSAIRDKIADQTDTRYKYNLTTNASADLAWWKLAVKNLSNVIIAYHPYCDIQHFKQIVELVKDSDINFSITINAHNAKDRWTDAVNIYDYYKCKNYPISFRALFSDHARGNNKFLPYDYDQWAFYTEINKIDVPDAPVETQIKWVENHLYNNYKGHLCWAGVEQIVIDYFGYTYRGWCHSHGVLGNIFESSVVLDTQPKVCPRIVCKNLFDQQAKKSEKSWGL